MCHNPEDLTPLEHCRRSLDPRILNVIVSPPTRYFKRLTPIKILPAYYVSPPPITIELLAHRRNKLLVATFACAVHYHFSTLQLVNALDGNQKSLMALYLRKTQRAVRVCRRDERYGNQNFHH